MKVKEIDSRVMRGPNYWSAEHHKLIVITLDFAELQDISFGDVLLKNILNYFPGTENIIFTYSEKFSGRDNSRFLASLIKEICVQLALASGMKSVFSDIDNVSGTRIFHIYFEYDEEETGWQTAKTAIDLFEHLLEKKRFDIKNEIDFLFQLRKEKFTGPTTYSIELAARKRDIPVQYSDVAGILILGHGKYLKRVQASISEETGVIAAELARNKEDTKKLLWDFFIPVPEGRTVYEKSELEEVAEKLKFPLAVKPRQGHHGNGVSTNIKTFADLEPAFERAQEFSDSVLVEKFITGNDYRLLVIKNKLVAAAQRVPASVVGNGKSTIQQLIDKENRDPRRGAGHENILTRIEADEDTVRTLKKNGKDLLSVPEKDVVVVLKETANISTGGTSIDVTDEIHPVNRDIVERAARLVGLDICGIDVIAPDLKTPLNENGGAIIEINAAPGLRMHFAPSSGKARDVASHITDFLFPANSTGRIPIIAITGTNGKTTTARLIAHLEKAQSMITGLTCTDGIYLDGKLLASGDFTGVKSAQVVLQDPLTEIAVLECARGGILRSGLAFDYCDIGIVMNVGDDHLGLRQVNTIDDMARVKAVVAKAVGVNGYAVLNADDDRVYAMREHVRGKFALFSMDAENERIRSFISENGIAATVVNGCITILNAGEEVKVAPVAAIPITFGGKASFNIQNILASVLAAYLLDFDVEKIKSALLQFNPTPDQTPGRMNFFDFGKFQVLVDYAHNPPSIEALGQFLRKMKVRKKTGIITGVGDRRDDYLLEIGRKSAAAFDNIIIRIDKDTRGRSPDEIIEFIKKGIHEAGNSMPVEVIPDETRALETAIERATENEIIIVATEKVSETIDVVKRLQKKKKDVRN